MKARMLFLFITLPLLTIHWAIDPARGYFPRETPPKEPILSIVDENRTLPVIESLDFRIAKLELRDGEIIGTMRLTYLGDPELQQSGRRDFLEVAVGEMPWHGHLFEIAESAQHPLRRADGGAMYQWLAPAETRWQRLSPGDSIQEERNLSFVLGPSRFDEAIKHLDDFIVRGFVRCSSEKGDIRGLATTQRDKPVSSENATVFDLDRDESRLTQRIDPFGIPLDSVGVPLLRDFGLTVERLKLENGRIYATVCLTCLGNSNGPHSIDLHSIEIARDVSLWKGKGEPLFLVHHIPKKFARQPEPFLDSLGHPNPRWFFVSAGFSSRATSPVHPASWGIDLTEHFDLEKASKHFGELNRHARDIQIQCLISYREGREQKGGLVSTH